MNKDISVIIAAHKKYKMPEDGMYIPMQVGSQGKPDIGLDCTFIFIIPFIHAECFKKCI